MDLKIGVLSDTHLTRVNRDFERVYAEQFSGVDIILHAGDFVSPEIVEFFSTDNFHGVHGNMDTDEVREMLPFKKVLNLDIHRIGLIHGWGAPNGLEDRIKAEFENVNIVVYGHSHHRANHIRDGILFFNPGSAFGPSRFGQNSIGILEVNDTDVKGTIIDI